MATLHWVSFGPERADLSKQVLAWLAHGDTLLFVGNGVLHLTCEGSELSKQGYPGYYQSSRVAEKHLNSKLATQFAPVDLQQIAKLTLSFARTITWHEH